jgi:hypothetical protein
VTIRFIPITLGARQAHPMIAPTASTPGELVPPCPWSARTRADRSAFTRQLMNSERHR